MIQEDLPEISVIVPVYGAEQYLRPCVDSILSQSYQNFELLLIDDGSLDSSGRICDEYAAKDPRITVFHRQNQGVSRTRNFGIQQAAGEYILFVDADDLIQPDYIEKLYRAFPQDEESAISMCGFQLLQGESLIPKLEQLFEFCADQDSLYERFLNPLITRKMQGTCWRVLFPKNLLKKYNISFCPCKIAEDLLFFMEVISHCRRIGICKEYLYLYRQIEQSSSHRSYITNYLPDRLVYLEKLREILENLNLEQEQRRWLLSFSFQFYRMILYMNATASPNFKIELAQLDESPFGTYQISKKMEKKFSAQLGRKHRVLNFLVKHRMFSAIARIRSHKK